MLQSFFGAHCEKDNIKKAISYGMFRVVGGLLRETERVRMSERDRQRVIE